MIPPEDLNSRQRETLRAIFRHPALANIPWADIEALLMALGATKTEGRGSRVRFALGGVKAVFHRPHQHETPKPLVKDVRRFLMEAGVEEP